MLSVLWAIKTHSKLEELDMVIIALIINKERSVAFPVGPSNLDEDFISL
jgi:hypothetical protein